MKFKRMNYFMMVDIFLNEIRLITQVWNNGDHGHAAYIIIATEKARSNMTNNNKNGIQSKHFALDERCGIMNSGYEALKKK